MAKKKNIKFHSAEAVGDSTKTEELTPEQRRERVVSTLTGEIGKMESKDFTFYFFVMDTKGTPNGTLNYMYDTAMELKDMGYRVAMLHGDKEFVGVGEWMGEEYASLPHYNIEKDGVKMSASDFLIIPELFSNVMYRTMNLPCKRIVMLTNYNYLTEVIQPGVTWGEYNLIDCVVSSSMLEDKIKGVFPYLRTKVVRNMVSDRFKDDGEPKKLFVNIVSKSPSDMNRVVKEFFWKYPIYKWVAFRDIRGLSQENLADALKESFLTVWIDEKSNFGYTPLEAMKAGNVVIARIPEEKVEWAYRENGEINDSCIWFDKMDDVQQLIAWAIDMFMGSRIPSEITGDASMAYSMYSKDKFTESVRKAYIDGYVEERKKELETALSIANKQ